MFSINDENIEEQVKHQEFSENKDNKNVLKFLIIRDENKLMEVSISYSTMLLVETCQFFRNITKTLSTVS